LRVRNLRKILFITVLGGINFSMIYWLYEDMTTKRVVETEGFETVGNLNFKNNEVKRKFSNSIVWDSVDINESLYQNDSVLTLDNSEAIVKLDSGAEIELDPNSMIILERIKDAIKVNFIRGNIFTKSGKKALKITFKDRSVDLKNARASISGSNVAVHSGEVKIGKTEVKKDEIANIDKKGITTVERNLFQVIRPLRNEKILINNRSQSVEFKWTSFQQNNLFNFEIARERDFKRSIFSPGFNSIGGAINGYLFTENLTIVLILTNSPFSSNSLIFQ